MSSSNQEYQPINFDWDGTLPHKRKKPNRGTGFWLMLLVVAVAVTVLLTYTVTSALNRAQYQQQLERQQQMIEQLRSKAQLSDLDLEHLDILAALFEEYSYYAKDVSQEELLTAVMKAYAEATGDRYAEYYTEEEYAAMSAENAGDHVGIGVSVVHTSVSVDGVEYLAFQIIGVYQNGPAAAHDLRIGDLIYAIKIDGATTTVSSLGYTKALSAFAGEAGTTVEFFALRPTGGTYETVSFAITRGAFESESVTVQRVEQNPEIGILRISNFDLTTPTQLKAGVKALKAQGVTKFVFDVRNNPGGDLQSIRACLSYFLQKGDLILASIDRDGKVVRNYKTAAMTLSGEYASCSVREDEIGMFADLDMVVLCNENTASAAEVFTATLYDYQLAHVIGETTFGKGIMQSYLPLSTLGNYKGYAKMTTYAYVTQRGVTYHEVGVAPHESVALSEEAKSYHFYLLPQEKDNQLQAAIAHFE